MSATAIGFGVGWCAGMVTAMAILLVMAFVDHGR